jgi:hypothetical protein
VNAITLEELAYTHKRFHSQGFKVPPLTELLSAARLGHLWQVNSIDLTGLPTRYHSISPAIWVVAADRDSARKLAVAPYHNLARAKVTQINVPPPGFDKTIMDLRFVRMQLVAQQGGLRAVWNARIERIVEHILGRRSLLNVLNDLEEAYHAQIFGLAFEAKRSAVERILFAPEDGIRSRGAPETIEGMIAMYRKLALRRRP